MQTSSHRCWIEVSRSAIASNFAAVRALVGPSVEVCPVVKADAYGHGAIEVSRTLVAAGARWLAVSSTQEGVLLREAGIAQPRILVMADQVFPSALAEHRLTPAVHDLTEIALFDHSAAPVAYHLKVDSGMGRLGTRAPAAEIARAVSAARNARLEGLMTHFASAADYASAQTGQQCGYFEEVCAALPFQPRYRHMASTVAIAYRRTESWKEMVRPGHAIYGYVSPIVRGGDKAPLNQLRGVRPALSWKASILTVKDVPAGARIGYGAMFTAPAPMRIGIVAAGYADGIPHQLRGKGSVIAGGRIVPILGAISMDVCTVDLTSVPGLAAGDTVTLLGAVGEARIDAQQIARAAGTISYSVLCGISARVHHVYTE
jgi:alanine racemase